MKVTITPDGSLELEINNTADALEFIKALRQVNNVEYDVQPADNRQRPAEETVLSPQLAETWNTLNGNYITATPAEVAATLDITTAAASWRINQLVKRGLVERVERGVYRVVE